MTDPKVADGRRVLGVVPGQPFDPDKVAKIDGAKFRKVSEQAAVTLICQAGSKGFFRFFFRF